MLTVESLLCLQSCSLAVLVLRVSFWLYAFQEGNVANELISQNNTTKAGITYDTL